MDQDREQRIREHAHRLWEEAGSPEGRDLEFWHRAEQEIGGRTDQPGLGESATAWRDPAEGSNDDAVTGAAGGGPVPGESSGGPEASVHIGGAAAAGAKSGTRRPRAAAS